MKKILTVLGLIMGIFLLATPAFASGSDVLGIAGPLNKLLDALRNNVAYLVALIMIVLMGVFVMSNQDGDNKSFFTKMVGVIIILGIIMFVTEVFARLGLVGALM